MKSMKLLLAGLLATVVVSGCATRVGDFTVASTKNMDVKSSLHRVDESERVVARDVAHIILVFPLRLPNMKEAMDNTIEKRPGAVGLSNVTVKRGGFYIPFLYGQDYYEVEGNPIYEAK